PAPTALRPAHVSGLEDPPPPGHPEPAGHRRRGGHLTSAMSPYDPSPDVIEVIREPAPGAMAGAYRAFGATLKGLRTTFARIVEGPVTIQYPEEKTPVYPRFRGRHKLHRFEDT